VLRAAVLLAGLWLIGCAPSTPDLAPRAIHDTEDLILALGDSGAWVARSGELPAGVFGTPGERLLVGNEEVAVYEYPDSGSRERASLTIAPDGQSIAGQPMQWRNPPHIWAAGGLIVVYQGTDGPTVLLLNAMLGDPIARGAAAGQEPYPPAVVAAISALAQDLSVDPGTIQVVGFEEGQWPDACLGLAGPGEMCAMVITPGWRVTLRVQEREYVARTDLLGGILRWEH
jgi:hypothetical protein